VPEEENGGRKNSFNELNSLKKLRTPNKNNKLIIGKSKDEENKEYKDVTKGFRKSNHTFVHLNS